MDKRGVRPESGVLDNLVGKNRVVPYLLKFKGKAEVFLVKRGTRKKITIDCKIQKGYETFCF